MFEAQEINAEHKDLIHDVAYDYYGERMATCSSDQFVKVWDQNSEGKWALTSSWKAHSGSVWKVTWAHPEFGQVLATCSFDRTAVVWEEVVGETPGGGNRLWVRRTNLVDSRTSVTDVKFGPHTQGLQLATCSAEGVIRIYEAPDVMNLSQWTLQHEVQCKMPCSCLSWNPSLSKVHPQMLAVGSDDPNPANGNKVLIFVYSESNRRWAKLDIACNIVDAVHDISFSPNLGRSYHVLAVATKDVRILNLTHVYDNSNLQNVHSKLECQTVGQFDDHASTVWRVCWNVTGTILASSGDDGCVRMFKMNYINSWKPVAVLKGDGSQVPDSQRLSTSSSAGQSTPSASQTASPLHVSISSHKSSPPIRVANTHLIPPYFIKRIRQSFNSI